MEFILGIICIGAVGVGIYFLFKLIKWIIVKRMPALIFSATFALLALIFGIILQNSSSTDFLALAASCAISSSLAFVISTGHRDVLDREDNKIHFHEITGLLIMTGVTLAVVGIVFAIFGSLNHINQVFIVVPVIVIIIIIRQTIIDFKE